VNRPSVKVALGALFVASFLFFFSARESRAVILVHSNDVLGELEPCGCRTNPLGGYPRKANLLKSLEKDHGGDQLIQVDAGDLLYPSTVIPEMLKKQSLIQAQYNLKTLGLLHHDVIVPGEKDFALGAASLLKLASATKIHFLAGNLFNRNSPKPLFPASVILTRKDPQGKMVRVAILGLVGKDLEWPAGLKITDPVALAKKLVPELRKKADYVVAVTHEGLEADRELAKKVHGIDFIIGGHTQSFLQNPDTIGKTTILQSSFRNQYVGLVDLSKYHGASQPAEEYYRLVALDANFDSPADKLTAVDDIVKEFKAEVARANIENDQVVPVNSTHGKYQTFPRCAECHLKQFDFWRKTPHINALHALVEANQDKNKECLSCHTVGLGDPKGVNSVNQLIQLKVVQDSSEDGEKTKQKPPIFVSNAEFVHYLDDLKDAKTIQSEIPKLSQSSDPSKTIQVDASLNQINMAWTPVQCENCHGAGHDHPFRGEMHKKVENTVCMSCHTPTRAPDWYMKDGKPNWETINAKHAQIACPAGELTLEN
jgi:hypothetical protein